LPKLKALLTAAKAKLCHEINQKARFLRWKKGKTAPF